MSQIQIHDQFIDAAGGELFTRSWTPEALVSANPLVLLHDSLGSVDQWRDFPQVLAFRTRRRVIAYDRLGFGQSSARQGLPSRNFVEEEATTHFPAVAAGLGFRRFALFGHSVGGGMALAIAAREPENCEAVVTESAQAFVETRTLDGIRAAESYFADEDAFGKLRRWHGDKARWVLDAWTKVWLSSDFAHWSVDESLRRITSPTLAIHGDQDEYGSVAFPERIARGVQGRATVAILSGCGHVPHKERAEEVVSLVTQFLDELPST